MRSIKKISGSDSEQAGGSKFVYQSSPKTNEYFRGRSRSDLIKHLYYPKPREREVSSPG